MTDLAKGSKRPQTGECLHQGFSFCFALSRNDNLVAWTAFLAEQLDWQIKHGVFKMTLVATP